MTLSVELKILNDEIKANQAQYDLDEEAAKISASSSKELHKYKYLTGEDLGYKPGVTEKVKFEYSPLGKVLDNKAKSKTNKTKKLDKINIRDKNLIYNSWHASAKFNDISDFKEMSLDSMH